MPGICEAVDANFSEIEAQPDTVAAKAIAPATTAKRERRNGLSHRGADLCRFMLGAALDSERAALSRELGVLCFLLLQQPVAFDPIAAREGTTGPPRLGANGFL